MSYNEELEARNAALEKILEKILLLPSDAVRYTVAQSLTEAETAQAQANIGLGDAFIDKVAARALEMLGGNPVWGYVEEATKSIILHAPEGDYTYYYVLEDGSLVEIGKATEDNETYYAITNNLTNCVSSNSATQVAEGGSYEATITANAGYELESVAVTMGGSAVTVSDGVINISNVTGNIVVTATAAKKQEAQPVTVDINITKDYSISVGDGSLRGSTSPGFCTTDFVELASIPKPCTINLTGAGWAYPDTTTTGYVRFFVADTSGDKLAGDYTHSSKMPSGVTMTYNDADRNDITVTVTSSDIGKVRFAGCYGNSGGASGTTNFEDAKATLTYTPN